MRAVQQPSCGGAAAAPHAVSGGGEGRGNRGSGRGGRRARGAGGWGGGWRGGAHVAVCGLEVHPLLHEALEGGEVALLRRIAKSLLPLRAQPSALSASQEPGWGPRLGAGAKVGARGRRRWRWRSMHTAAALARAHTLIQYACCRLLLTMPIRGAYSCHSPESTSMRRPMPKPYSAYNHGMVAL